MIRQQNTARRQEGQRSGQKLEQIGSEVKGCLWSIGFWNMIATGGSKGSFCYEICELNWDLQSVWFVLLKVLEMVGDLAGKPTGLMKQDLHGWEAVGRAECNSIYVKIGGRLTPEANSELPDWIVSQRLWEANKYLMLAGMAPVWLVVGMLGVGLGLEGLGWGYGAGFSVGFWTLLPLSRQRISSFLPESGSLSFLETGG